MEQLSTTLAAGWRRSLWGALLIAASLAFTCGFACAVPFAAFGAIAAQTLPRRDALLLTGALWLANQAVGYAVLHYPGDAATLVWGAVLGAVALLSTAAAQAANRRHGIGSAIAGFAAAFAAYEGGLYVASAMVMGGAEIYTAPTVARILAINAAAFVGLCAASLLLASVARTWREVLPSATRPV